jgi:DNA-binding CsgD family transcriptional regulator
MASPDRRHRGNSPARASKRIVSVEPRPLTKRELEVVEWIAEGKRNGEIGQIIGCSSRTVQKHVQHILEKLHVETRTAACSWWFQRRLDGMRHIRARKKSAR